MRRVEAVEKKYGIKMFGRFCVVVDTEHNNEEVLSIYFDSGQFLITRPGSAGSVIICRDTGPVIEDMSATVVGDRVAALNYKFEVEWGADSAILRVKEMFKTVVLVHVYEPVPPKIQVIWEGQKK